MFEVRILVLGLGNPLRADDGVGHAVVNQLGRKLHHEEVDIKAVSTWGINLLEVIQGYENLILVDAIRTGGEPGKIFKLGVKDLGESGHSSLSHTTSLLEVLEVGKLLLQDKMPKKITIFAVEADDKDSFSEELSPRVRNSVPRVVTLIEEEVAKILARSSSQPQSRRKTKTLKC